MVRLLVLALVPVIALACKGAAGGDAPLLQAAAPSRVDVRVRAVGTARQEVVTGTGTLLAGQETVILAEVPGKVVRLHAEEGDRVKAGQPLVELDTTDLALGLRKAEADLKGAELMLATTRDEFDRIRRLREEGAVSQAQYDGMKLKLDLAENGVRTARVGLDLARRRLTQATIRAPYDAVVVNRLASVGTVIQVMPPTAIYRLQDIRNLRLKVKVPELSLRDVAVGDRVEARIESLGVDVVARVDQVVSSVDPMSRTFEVIANVDNAMHNMALVPGAFATVRILHETADTRMLVPRAQTMAVAGREGEARAFVVDGDKAWERRLKVEAVDRSTYAVLEGLKPGDRLVVSDTSGLSDGRPVNVIE